MTPGERRAGQAGSVSVVVAAVAALTLSLAVGAADLARVLAAAARAQAAADAAALAAAQELAIPSGRDPGAVAAEYATRNGATLTGCTCETGSLEARVEVVVAVGRLVLGPDDRVVGARARAVVEIPPP